MVLGQHHPTPTLWLGGTHTLFQTLTWLGGTPTLWLGGTHTLFKALTWLLAGECVSAAYTCPPHPSTLLYSSSPIQ